MAADLQLSVNGKRAKTTEYLPSDNEDRTKALQLRGESRVTAPRYCTEFFSSPSCLSPHVNPDPPHNVTDPIFGFFVNTIVCGEAWREDRGRNESLDPRYGYWSSESSRNLILISNLLINDTTHVEDMEQVKPAQSTVMGIDQALATSRVRCRSSTGVPLLGRL
jgi:hypothetical protein